MFSRCPACGSRRHRPGRRGRCRRCSNPRERSRRTSPIRGRRTRTRRKGGIDDSHLHTERRPIVRDDLRVRTSIAIGSRRAVAVGEIGALALLAVAIADLGRVIAVPTRGIEFGCAVFDGGDQSVTRFGRSHFVFFQSRTSGQANQRRAGAASPGVGPHRAIGIRKTDEGAELRVSRAGAVTAPASTTICPSGPFTEADTDTRLQAYAMAVAGPYGRDRVVAQCHRARVGRRQRRARGHAIARSRGVWACATDGREPPRRRLRKLGVSGRDELREVVTAAAIA